MDLCPNFQTILVQEGYRLLAYLSRFKPVADCNINQFSIVDAVLLSSRAKK